MKNLKLKLNHVLFWWYYKRVPEFFHQWPILKSISLLKQNYEHRQVMYDGLEEVVSKAIKREDELNKTISNLRMQIIATDDQIRGLNKTFGTDFKGKADN